MTNHQQLYATLYQIAGAYDLPESVMDVLSKAQAGEDVSEEDIDALLPCHVVYAEQIGVLDSNGQEVCVGDTLRVLHEDISVEFKVYKNRGTYWLESLTEDYITETGDKFIPFYDLEEDVNIKEWCDNEGWKLEVIDND
jgi:hypothetical protein